MNKFKAIPYFVQSHGLACIEGGNGYYSILHVMDLYSGGTLKSWFKSLKDGGGIDGHQAIKLAHSLCEALTIMHSKNVAHRDLKPDNIFLDEQHNIYIGDFGQAYSLDELQKKENKKFIYLQGAPMFTHGDYSHLFHVAAPAQAGSGSRLDIAKKNDYWSMGLILLQALSGEKRRSWWKSLPKGEAAAAWGDATTVTSGQIVAEISQVLLKADKLNRDERGKLNNLLQALLKVKLNNINDAQIASACRALS